MAEASKSGILARAQKRLSRTKTKVLQNLGKAERTTDEQFDELVGKIEQQQESAHHLHKELKKYLQCLEALSVASKSFYSAVEETYEAKWTEELRFTEALKSSEATWSDYLSQLHEKVQDPMATYLASFPALKSRIAKRGRKLMYYDNAKHAVDVIQMAKKKDEVKVHKAHEDLTNAKKVYTTINNELHEELPQFINSRVTFYAQLFGDLFTAEKNFHGQIAQVANTETEIAEQLQKDFKEFVYVPKRPISSFSDGRLDDTLHRSGDESNLNGDHSFDEAGTSLVESNPSSPVKVNGGDNIYTNQSAINKALSVSTTSEDPNIPEQSGSNGTSSDETKEKEEKTQKSEQSSEEGEKKVNGIAEPQPDVPDYPPPRPPDEEAQDINVYDEPKSPSDEKTSLAAETVASSLAESVIREAESAIKDSEATKNVDTDNKTETVTKDPETTQNNSETTQKSSETTQNSSESQDTEKHLYQNPTSNMPVKEAPLNFLYQVQATHSYNGEDVDELSFDANEIIWVIPYENEEEQDDGWVMGIKQSDGVKGVFPENFTRKLNT